MNDHKRGFPDKDLQCIKLKSTLFLELHFFVGKKLVSTLVLRLITTPMAIQNFRNKKLLKQILQ